MKFPGAGLAIGLCLLASSTLAADKVSFGTNWLAEAEHGGYYQAVADGTYAKYGLDVTIVQGGPQANNELLLAAGRLDFYMGGNLLLAFDAVARDVPIVVVAADFQKDPQIFMSHPGVGLDKWADLPKATTAFVGKEGLVTFYQWMSSAYGFKEENVKPYTFNPGPFIADTHSIQQGYVTSEPFAVEREGHFKPNIFLLGRQWLRDLCDDDRDPRRSGQGSSGRRPAVRRRVRDRLVQLPLRRQFESECSDQEG